MFKVNWPLRTIAGTLLFITFASALFLTIPTAKAESDVVDRITISVPVSCSMSSSLTTDHTAEINNGQTTNEIGTTNITTFCNDSSGYAIYAIGYTDNEYGNTVLTSPTVGSTHDIATSTTITTSTSSWAMKLAEVSGTYTPIIAGSTNDTLKEQGDPDFSNYQSVPEEYTKVAYYPVSTDVGSLATGSSFTTTYRAHISPTQPAGTYVGQVKYTLVHPNGDFPFPEDTLVGTTLRFNEHIDVESLVPIIGGEYQNNDLIFSMKVTAADIADYFDIQDMDITTWSQLVTAAPSLLPLMGATDIQSDMIILDESQDYAYIKYFGFYPFIYSDPAAQFLFYRTNGNDIAWSDLPASTGSLSFTFDGDSYVFNSFRELAEGMFSGAWLSEHYYQDNWTHEFFRTISIIGGSDANDPALIQWLQDNSTASYVMPSLDDEEWTFNEAILSDPSMAWNVSGDIYNDEYTPYYFTSIYTNTDYGVPIWSFHYDNPISPYTNGDGFIYIAEDLVIPAYGINYTAGWYFGNANSPTQYVSASPPTVLLWGGEDRYNPSFNTWLHTNANDEWAFKEITTLSSSNMFWGISGLVYSDQYAPYNFDYIGTNTDYGVPIWSFFYDTVTEPYDPYDGFVYIAEDLDIPAYGINYTAGWYFGNGNYPSQYVSVSPPTIKITGGADSREDIDFVTWLRENALPD